MFERLNKLIREEKVSLFIGAGFSREACAPSVDDLKQAILEEISNEEQKVLHENDSLADLTNYFVEEVCLGSRTRLLQILHQKFEFVPKCMDDHKLLAKIPHFKHIFTTNYDTLLEDSYPKSDVKVIRNDKDCAYQEKPFTIFKIHGDFTDPDSVVITSDDYTKFFKKNNNPIMWGRVTTEFAEKNILFIGYSLEDENILKIIENVSKALKRNQKEMFLIAPMLNEDKQAKLDKLGIHYFKTVANVFLTQLYKELEENITKDIENKKVNAETYSRFLDAHKMAPMIIMPSNDKYIVEDLKPLSGATLKREIKFTVNGEPAKKLCDLDFERDGELTNPIYSRIPCFVITKNNLVNGKYLVNNIVVKRDFEKIIISPSERQISLSFLIPSKNFFESIPAKCYRLNPHTLKIIVDCDAFDMTITLHLPKESGNTVVTFNFDFRSIYKNNNEAIKWIEVVCALFSNEEIFIQELSEHPLNMKNALFKQKDTPFEYFKEYYNNISEIEKLTRKKFKYYKECTEESWKASCVVLLYLQGYPATVRCEDEKYNDFSIKVSPAEDIAKEENVNVEISIVTMKDEGLSYVINGRKFDIPYQLMIFNSCVIKNIQKVNDGNMRVDIHYPSSTYLLLYSDKSMSERYPEMKPLKLL